MPSLRTPRCRFAGLAIIITVGMMAATAHAHAHADDDAIDAMHREVQALRTEVATIRQQRTGDGWLTAQRADEIRLLVADVLADADTRSNLAANGLTAGHDGGFFIASDDGNFRLRVWGSIQVRFVYNNQDGTGIDNHRWGFQNRRTRLGLRGHIGDPSWTYSIQTDFSSSTGILRVLDAQFEKDLGNGWSIRAGKFMLPFTRQSLTSHSRLLAVDRSMVNNYFSAGRAEAIQVTFEQDAWKIAVSLNDGRGSISGTSAPALAEDTEYSITGRADLLLTGSRRTFRDMTSFRGDDPGVLLGAAVHWQEDEYGTPTNNDELEFIRWTLDCSIELGGANAFLAAFGNHADSASGAGDVDQFGLLVQGGVFVTDELEIYGRYQWGDEDAPTAVDDLSVITLGVNRYFFQHGLKWTTDVNYGLNGISSTWAGSSFGTRADAPGEDGQLVVRSQLQVRF